MADIRDLMLAELADSATCTCCGEQRRAHYRGVLLGCRRGRTFFTPNAEFGFTIDRIGRTQFSSTEEY